MSDPISLRSFQSAILVAQHGSFRKAALTIGVRPSTLSRQVRSLEDSIGVSIFERHSGGVRLTNAGFDFLEAIGKALREIDYAVCVAAEAGRGELGRLRIGFYTSLLGGELRNLLIDYTSRFPGVAVRMVEAGAAQLAARLHSQQIDVAIVTNASLRPWSADLLDLWDERVMLALPKEHRLSGQKAIRWDDLAGLCCVLPSCDPGVELREQICRKTASAYKAVTIVQHDISFDNLLGLVAAGAGITLLYESATAALHSGIVYREVLDNDSVSLVRCVAAWNSRNDNPALRRFLSLIRERYLSRPSLAVLSGFS